MITCSNCKTNFPIVTENMKGGNLFCPNCLTSCPVTLYQLQENYDEKAFSGFQDLSETKEISPNLEGEEADNPSQLVFHLNILLLVFICLINLFTLGIIKLETLESFSAITGFYSAIGVTRQEKIALNDIKIVKEEKGYLVEMQLMNQGKKVDLLSDIKIIFYDSYYQEVGELSLIVMQLIKPGSSNVKVQVVTPSDDIKFLAIKMNDQKLGDKVTLL